MLETIGAYATEKLAESGEREAIRRRHAEAFRDLAERAAPELTARDQKRWLDRLALEHDNLRAALAFAVEAGDPELGLRLVAALWRFWQIRGHLVEGTSRADAVLALPGAARAGEPYIVALDAAGGLRYWQADFDGAQRRYEEVLEARRGGGDERAIAEALYNLSFTELFGRADMVRARQLGEEALAAFRRVGDRGGEARAHWQLANVGRDQGDLAAARQHCLEAIELLRAQGLSFMLAWSLFTLGQVETLDGHLETGASRFLEALELFAGADDMSGFVLVLDALAMIAWQSGDRHRAARLSGAVRQLEAATGTGLNRRNRASLRFDPLPLRDDPATAAAWLEGTRWSTDEAVAYAREAVAPGAPGRPVAAAGAAEVGREARPASRG